MALSTAQRIARLDREIDAQTERVRENEHLARTAAPRSRFAYAAAATKGRGKLTRLEDEYNRLVRQARSMGEIR